MKVLVVGATGATGRLLVTQLLEAGCEVRAIVRTPGKLGENLSNNNRLSIIKAGISDLTESELASYIKGCDAVASCLGHNLTLKGIFGHPRRLVTDATRNLCNAIKAISPAKPVKYVLMNTTGNRNRDTNETVSFSDKVVVGIIRLLVPPQRDNEEAAEYLRTKTVKGNASIQWVVVRPDSLIDEELVSAYKVYPSPVRSILFNAGKTSRINVARFMTDLITNENEWNRWKGQMPVIYNEAWGANER